MTKEKTERICTFALSTCCGPPVWDFVKIFSFDSAKPQLKQQAGRPRTLNLLIGQVAAYGLSLAGWMFW
ncbi:hypothetical protein [Oligoflexus tunisiensis]|uniref:hypothetical protein n=1 Tax=Oligoflexus tunisiensis TaxID=708132 RepID=UPI001C4063A8|nr:hypothetical protein [Oligoflexus tunisiensis]